MLTTARSTCSVPSSSLVAHRSAAVGNGHFKFTATVQGYGSVVGLFVQVRELFGLVIVFYGVVTCLTVNSELHRARFGGVMTENN